MTTYIIFDTNILFIRNHESFSEYTFNRIFEEIQGKIQRHDVENNFTLLIPQIAVDELFQQQLEEYEIHKKILLDTYKKYKNIYGINLEFKDDIIYVDYLQEIKDNFVNNNNFDILPICTENRFPYIVERALSKKAPFEGGNKGNSDKGFKDALIWESILEYASQSENNGEYIFLTNDKGFKNQLTKEFSDITGNNITFYDKNEKQKLDMHIDKYSHERVIKLKLEKINENINDIIDELIREIESEIFVDLNINGIHCEVSLVEIEEEIVDLNEIGDELFQFKLKGKVLAEKTGLLYNFNIQIKVIVNVIKNKFLDINSIQIEEIEATLLSGDNINLVFEPFNYIPFKEEIEEETEETEETEEETEETEEETEETVEGSERKVKIKQPSEVNASFTEEGKERLMGLLTKKEYIEIFSTSSLIFNDEFVVNFVNTIEKNMQFDWPSFPAKKAHLKIAIRNFLKKNNVNEQEVPKLVVFLIHQLEQDTKEFFHIKNNN